MQSLWSPLSPVFVLPSLWGPGTALFKQGHRGATGGPTTQSQCVPNLEGPRLVALKGALVFVLLFLF